MDSDQGVSILSMEDHRTPFAKWTWKTVAAAAVAVLPSYFLSRAAELSDESLSLCRATIKQVYTIGCFTCATVNGGIPPFFVDRCRCGDNPGSDCLQCEHDGGEDGQVLQQGNPSGNPGWLSGSFYSCSGALLGGICNGANCIDLLDLGEDCNVGYTANTQEGGG